MHWKLEEKRRPDSESVRLEIAVGKAEALSRMI